MLRYCRYSRNENSSIRISSYRPRSSVAISLPRSFELLPETTILNRQRLWSVRSTRLQPGRFRISSKKRKRGYCPASWWNAKVGFFALSSIICLIIWYSWDKNKKLLNLVKGSLKIVFAVRNCNDGRGCGEGGFRDRYEKIFDVQMLDALIVAACHFIHWYDHFREIVRNGQ